MSFDLARARVNKGHSVRGLAREVGVSEPTLRRLERGEVVRPESAKPIADYFKVQVTDLMPPERTAV